MRAFVLAVAVTGCTSSSMGGSISGQMPGGTFEPMDSISASIAMSDGAGGTTSTAQIDVASTGHLCSDASASPPIVRKGQRYVTLNLSDVAGAMRTAPAAPGTYTIYPNSGTEPPKSASLIAGAFDSNCQPNDTDSAQAQAGSVTLTSITGGAFAGTFDVTLNTGGHITGSFEPESCAQLATAVTSTVTPSCR